MIIVALLAVAAGGCYALTERLGSNVHRVPDVFEQVEEAGRPAPTQALTFLLVGTDSRSPEPTTGTGATGEAFVPGAQRTDVVMLVRIAQDRTHAEVVSIPRDSWVPIPGRGMAKINAAYSWGGPPLLIQTVEQLTKLRIDHFAVIDFAGFQEMADSVGGIDVRVAAATSNDRVDFRAGANHLDGRQALAYVRQRYDLPHGDLDRVHRHQQALRALVEAAAARGALSDPIRTYQTVDVVTRWVGVDDTLTNAGLRSLAFELRGLRSSNVVALTAPVRGLGREGSESVVYLDKPRSTELWHALGSDTLRDELGSFGADLLPETPA